MSAYYNEIDRFCAEWLRNLMKRGHIPDGVVDERSIAEVQPEDVAEFAQCHFFAGVAGWSHALRLAQWPDDRPVWTGSCPCQPFSAAGKQQGIKDERHLWPEFHRLIAQRRPPTVFGEQVASKLGREWLAGVRADLEALGYAVGAADLCAASVGAPHIRQRLFWVADADGGIESDRDLQRSGQYGFKPQDGGAGEWMGDASSARLEERPGERGDDGAQCAPAERAGGDAGFWSDAYWLPCLDGKARRIEPGSFPLVDRTPARVGRLRAYGNAISPEVAQAFITAWMETMP